MADINDPTLNVNIANDDNSKLVSVITDGSTERLAVDARLSISVPNQGNISGLTSAGYVYSCAFRINMPSAGTNNPLFLLKNPSGSGKTVYIYSMRFGVDVENNYANFIVYSNPTITANGTTETSRNRCIGGGFGASSMLTYTTPTISANGNQIENVEVAQNNNSIESAHHFSMHFKANNNMLVTGDPKSNNRAAVITIVWAEF